MSGVRRLQGVGIPTGTDNSQNPYAVVKSIPGPNRAQAPVIQVPSAPNASVARKKGMQQALKY